MDETESWRATPPPELRHEPVFTLKATDTFALDLVDIWIFYATQALGASHPKIASAQARLAQMKAWRRLHGTKVPD